MTLDFETLMLFQLPLLGGLGIALLSGPLGALLVWQRMAYLGDTLAHGSLLGVGISFVFGLALLPTTAATAIAIMAVFLAFSKGSLEKTTVSPETLLLGLSQGALAIGLLLMALSPGSNADLVGYLTGDFLMITLQDVSLIWGLLIVALILLQWFWSPLLAVLIHPDLAVVEGLSATQLQAGFLCIAALACMLILSATGVLFLSTLLVFPTLTLSPWARTPEQVCIWASLLAAFSVTVGLGLSIGLNIPTGPVITVLLLSFFAFSRLMVLLRK